MDFCHLLSSHGVNYNFTLQLSSGFHFFMDSTPPTLVTPCYPPPLMSLTFPSPSSHLANNRPPKLPYRRPPPFKPEPSTLSTPSTQPLSPTISPSNPSSTPAAESPAPIHVDNSATTQPLNSLQLVNPPTPSLDPTIPSASCVALLRPEEVKITEEELYRQEKIRKTKKQKKKEKEIDDFIEFSTNDYVIGQPRSSYIGCSGTPYSHTTHSIPRHTNLEFL